MQATWLRLFLSSFYDSHPKSVTDLRFLILARSVLVSRSLLRLTTALDRGCSGQSEWSKFQNFRRITIHILQSKAQLGIQVHCMEYILCGSVLGASFGHFRCYHLKDYYPPLIIVSFFVNIQENCLDYHLFDHRSYNLADSSSKYDSSSRVSFFSLLAIKLSGFCKRY